MAELKDIAGNMRDIMLPGRKMSFRRSQVTAAQIDKLFIERIITKE